MNNYEGVFIFPPTVNPSDSGKVLDPVTELITKSGGKVDSVDEWGRKRLAYQIRKNDEGYYVVINFSVDSLELAKINAALKLNPTVLKSLIIKKDPKHEEKLEYSRRTAAKRESADRQAEERPTSDNEVAEEAETVS